MAFSTSFLRHTMLWNLPQGEVAATRVHWRPSSPMVSIGAEGAELALRGAALWTAQKGQYSAETEYIGSRVQIIGTDGHVAETEEYIIAGVPGTEPENNLPTEVAVCISLRTATASRSGRGRVYWPAPSVGRATATGRYDSGTRDALAADFAAYAAPFTSGVVDYDLVVASTTQQLLRAVTEIRVGDVFDVQRRRRDALVESYAVEAV